jgi:hypothetical protein
MITAPNRPNCSDLWRVLWQLFRRNDIAIATQTGGRPFIHIACSAISGYRNAAKKHHRLVEVFLLNAGKSLTTTLSLETYPPNHQILLEIPLI